MIKVSLPRLTEEAEKFSIPGMGISRDHAIIFQRSAGLIHTIIFSARFALEKMMCSLRRFNANTATHYI